MFYVASDAPVEPRRSLPPVPVICHAAANTIFVKSFSMLVFAAITPRPAPLRFAAIAAHTPALSRRVPPLLPRELRHAPTP